MDKLYKLLNNGRQTIHTSSDIIYNVKIGKEHAVRHFQFIPFFFHFQIKGIVIVINSEISGPVRVLLITSNYNTILFIKTIESVILEI